MLWLSPAVSRYLTWDPEEMAMFTFARLLNPSQLQTTSVGELLAGISQYIFNTWGVNIDADDMDGHRRRLCSTKSSHHQSSSTRTTPELGPGTRGRDLRDTITVHQSNTAYYNTAIFHAYAFIDLLRGHHHRLGLALLCLDHRQNQKPLPLRDTDTRPRRNPFLCQRMVTRGTRPFHTIHSQVISNQANEWCIPRCSNWLM